MAESWHGAQVGSSGPAFLTEMCFSSTNSGESLWSVNERIRVPTSHQFVGQSPSAANLLRCSKRTIARNCSTASEGGSEQVRLGPLEKIDPDP
jgi:hypothetical protein